MSNLLQHLDREWAAMGWPTTGTDEPQAWIYKQLRSLLAVLADGGHSGSSAPYVVALFKKLAMFEPLGPLTGEDSEWVVVSDGLWQNIRASHVFKKDGAAYDINGKVFEEPGGVRYTSGDSHVPVTFPYTPVTEVVHVDAS